MNRIEDELQKNLQEVVSIGAKSSLLHKASYEKHTVKEELCDGFSDLQDLSSKIELCLKMQTKVRFITKEIAEIIKRQA